MGGRTKRPTKRTDVRFTNENGWQPPTTEQRQLAILANDDECPRWLCDCEVNARCFSPKPPLAHGDWLSGPGRSDRGGESYSQWSRQRRHPSWRPSSQRSTILLVPVGSCEGCDVAALQAFASAWFGLHVVLMPPVAIDALSNPGLRINDYGEQILTSSVLQYLKRHCKPPTAFCTVAVTMVDLYPDPKWNFVFGIADPTESVGCFSFARYRETLSDHQPSLLWRSCQTLVHEIGHLFGIAHCVWFKCAMNGANSLPESDTHPLHLCPVDLRKLQQAVAQVPSAVVGRARYEALLRFYEAAGAAFQAEAAWTRTRIAACDSLADSTDASWLGQQPSMQQCVACDPCEPMDVY